MDFSEKIMYNEKRTTVYPIAIHKISFTFFALSAAIGKALYCEGFPLLKTVHRTVFNSPLVRALLRLFAPSARGISRPAGTELRSVCDQRGSAPLDTSPP